MALRFSAIGFSRPDQLIGSSGHPYLDGRVGANQAIGHRFIECRAHQDLADELVGVLPLIEISNADPFAWQGA